MTDRAQTEWQRGWKVVLGCALASGTGVVLLFFTFSIFILPILAEFGGSRGDLAAVQSLIVAGALGSPILGRVMDQFGFRAVFLGSVTVVIVVELWIALFVTSVIGLAIGILLLGLVGVGTTGLTITRPVNAWFDDNRGLALGVAASGTAIATIVVPPGLEIIVADHGWRAGFLALAGLAAFISIPAVYFLVDNEPGGIETAPRIPDRAGSWAFMQLPQFWLMAISLALMGVAGSGFLGQLSPMIQEERLSAPIAALALSAFAGGQLSGRLIGGWCLDRFDPRLVAVLLNFVPAIGFVILWLTQGSAPLALIAAFLIGFQQGAELDIFAYFTARRFGIKSYGTVYGALIGIAWIGNAIGVIGVGKLHDAFGNYAIAQLLGGTAMAAGALLIAAIRLPPKGAAS